MNVRHAVCFVAGLFTGWTVVREIHKMTRKHNTLDGNQVKLPNDIEISKFIPTTCMRKFSEREQQVIWRLIEGTACSYSYVLFNVYNDITYRRNVEFQYDKNKSQLVFYRENLDQVTPEELLEIENEIMEISLLIFYLQANGLIYLIENTSVNELNKAGGFLKDGLQAVGMELDSNIAKILHDSLNHRVYVGYTLRELAENGFLSIEERTLEEARHQTQETRNMAGEAKRQADAASDQVNEAKQQTIVAKRQTRLSIFALVFSIISIIIGVSSSIWVAKSITMDVKIAPNQIDTITSKMTEIEDGIDSVNYHFQRLQDKESKTAIEPVNRQTKQ